MKVILIILLFSAALALANSPFQLKIVGGRIAQKGEFPHQVSLQFQPKNDPLKRYFSSCGGSIISINWILTAAHCVRNPSRVFKVVAGINRLSDKSGQERRIIKTIINKGYKKHHNDIALLQLDKPLQLNHLVKIISLPKEGAKFTGDVVGSGWGLTTNGTEPQIQDELKTEVFRLMSNDQCKIALKIGNKAHRFDDNSHICTGSQTVGSQMCKGDSGSSIVQKDVIVGITSWGIQPCGSTNPITVYTNVAKFIPFIHENVRFAKIM